MKTSSKRNKTTRRKSGIVTVINCQFATRTSTVFTCYVRTTEITLRDVGCTVFDLPYITSHRSALKVNPLLLSFSSYVSYMAEICVNFFARTNPVVTVVSNLPNLEDSIPPVMFGLLF